MSGPRWLHPAPGRAAGAALAALLLISPAAARTAPQSAPQSSPQSTVSLTRAAVSAPRGAIGEILFEYAGAPLCATADQPESARVLVRLSRLEAPAGAVASPPGVSRYRLTFIGSVAGDYDLLPFIEHCDGRPVTDLAPIRVSVFSQLPERHGTDLYLTERPLPSITGRYRVLIGVVLALWILLPAIVIGRRLLRRAAPPSADVPEPPPTLADQLRPLVEAAMDRGLSTADQGRLELLLLRYWRSRLALDALPPADAIARLRREPEAGRLLTAVEGWLHADRSRSSVPAPRVAELLEPYRHAAALPEELLVDSPAASGPHGERQAAS